MARQAEIPDWLYEVLEHNAEENGSTVATDIVNRLHVSIFRPPLYPNDIRAEFERINVTLDRIMERLKQALKEEEEAHSDFPE